MKKVLTKCAVLLAALGITLAVGFAVRAETEASAETVTESLTETRLESTRESLTETGAESAVESQTEQKTESGTETETAAAAEKHAILPRPGIVPEGVSVNGMDLAGKTYEDAEKQIEQFVKETLAGKITLTIGDDKKVIPFADFDMQASDHDFGEEIRKIGNEGTLISQYTQLADVREKKAAYEVTFSYDEEKLKEELTEAAESFNADVKEASLVRHSGEFILTESAVGRKVDVDKTVSEAEKALAEGWDHQSVTIEVTAEETQPEHTTEELAVIKDKLGSYSTEYWGSSDNRIANIANGARLIDETILYPGETFSFLKHVEPFSGANGYYEATGYAGGKVVPSIGGGICQVSTTLYNAVLRAELEVTQRSCHGLTVSYVPLAADATVSEGSVDFQFKNNLKDPIYIEAYTYEGSIYVSIYGKEYRSSSRSLDFSSVTESIDPPGEEVVTEDPELPADYEEVTQWEHDGYTASLYKNVYENGSLVDTVWINTSTYYSSPRYVTRGTGEAESESESGDESESQGEGSDLDEEMAADLEAADYE